MEYDICETCMGSGIVRVSVVLCRKCLKLKNSCVENNSPDSACNNCKGVVRFVEDLEDIQDPTAPVVDVVELVKCQINYKWVLVRF